MDFYFSGISSRHELDKLKEADVTRVLVDPSQYRKRRHELHHEIGLVALDSGAYSAWKAGKPRPLSDYITDLLEFRVSQGWFEFVTTLDVIEDDAKTVTNFRLLKAAGFRVLPIWHYVHRQDGIETYLDEPEIGIGRLVVYLHKDADPKLKTVCRARVEALCQALPNRLRLFGACDIPLLNRVAGAALSADSSVWLRGSRHGIWIYRDGEGRLREANRAQQRMLAGRYDGFEQALAMTPDELDIANARTLEAQFNQ